VGDGFFFCDAGSMEAKDILELLDRFGSFRGILLAILVYFLGLLVNATTEEVIRPVLGLFGSWIVAFLTG
jgi:uncharacterized membrane protein YGL010W